MSALYMTVPFASPLSPCQRMQRLFLCSASSGAMSGSHHSWRPLVSDASEGDGMRAGNRTRKRLQIAGVDQEELVDPWLLADVDSRFAELHGVQIHYKIVDASDEGEDHGSKEAVLSKKDDARKSEDVSDVSATAFASPSACVSSPSTPSSLMSQSSSMPSSIPAILLHGFGASLFSWERVMKPLARALRARIIAFDRPAFGLTSRVNVPSADSSGSSKEGLTPIPVNPYSVTFSSIATVGFVDLLQASKAVLIGHSAGCIIAADAYFKAPERIAALVLVAPALFAPMLLKNKVETMQEQNNLLEAFSNVWAKIAWVFTKIRALVQIVLSSIRLLWCRLLAAALRSDFGRWLIRIIMDKLSLQAVRLAWYDKNKVDDYVIAGYTKPLKCRDWEHALLEYVIALVGDPSTNEEQVSISERLEEIKCPVLVISGDSDALVPAWNAERLSKVLPNAEYCVIKNCGHLPQEEMPEEFLSVIQRFMQQIQHGTFKERASNETTTVFMPA